MLRQQRLDPPAYGEVRGHAHPFRPESAMPLMNRRWKMAKIRTIGSVEITEPAKSRLHEVWFLTTKSASPSGAV